MIRKALALALTVFAAACNGTDAVEVKGTQVPAVGWYAYRATTRDNVLLSGAMLLSYAGPDSISGDVLAADPQGKPYFDGHFVTRRGDDGTYVFQMPKSEHEPTSSSYVTRLYVNRGGYVCEFRDVLRGNTVTKSCELESR